MLLKRSTFSYNLLKSYINFSFFKNNLFLTFLSPFIFFKKLFQSVTIKTFLTCNSILNFFTMCSSLARMDNYSFRLLKFYGLGFKFSTKSPTLKLDMGWSHALFQQIPETLSILKKQDKLLVYGFISNNVFNFAEVVISLYARSAYQIKGVFNIHEQLKKKIGKQRQK